MKPEPLVNKKYEKFFRDVNEKAEEFVRVKDVKSACEFYLRYKDNPELLIKEYPEYNLIKFYFKCDEYNTWLFKLAFKDVLGGD